MVESGLPGRQLFVVHEGAIELLHKQALVDILTSGEIFGHPTLLTGLAPEFTARARTDSTVYCIPKDVAVELLSRPEGVRWLAGNHRERLLQAARSMSALPDVRTRPVTEVVRSAPVFCDPDTTIRDAAKLMIDERRSAILVRAPDGLGIVTDVDMRDKVVVGGVSRDAPVSTIMTTPGPHHRRRGAGARGQHRDDGRGREPPPRARRERSGGGHPVGQQPDDARGAEPLRAAPLDPVRPHREGPATTPPQTCPGSSSTCSTPTSTRRR